ncbi:MAG: hypothetical protein IJ315_06115 [Firmicutes bacterium]|nr:hypothetical protein [Bacillota bacterium]
MTQDERIKQGWEVYRGQPLVYAPIEPPVFEGHPRFSREFSRRIASFVIRVFHNKETEFYADANEALIRNAQFYIDNPDVRDDRDSFYWNIGEQCQAMMRYDSKGCDEPSLITPEAEAKFLEMALGYCQTMSLLVNADDRPLKTWEIYESENHHVQKNSALWQLEMILIRHGYGDVVLSDGADINTHFKAWTAFFTTWMKERPKRSMFVEVHSKCYGVDTMKNIFPIYNFAPTPELKKLTGDFITLFWALWAEEQINSNQGGGQTRVYPGSAVKAQGLHWAWYYTGVGHFAPPGGMDYVLLDCDYRMPELIVDMILHPEKRGTYVSESRPYGKSAPDNLFPNYRLDTDWGHMYRYTYCTPDYILGTIMCPQLGKKDWCAISSQNRFQGVVFGPDDALVLPLPEPNLMHNLHSVVPEVRYNSFWSMQAEGTLVTQRTLSHPAPMRVFFSQAADVRANAIEKDGWTFTYCGNAYVAVKVCQGGYTWEDDLFVDGQWIRCENGASPVILETGNAEKFGSFEAFQEAVLALAAPTFKEGVMKYHSLYGHDFVMVTDHDSKDSTIDGEYYVKKPDFSFKSPFINGAWGGDEVKITYDGQEMILKF